MGKNLYKIAKEVYFLYLGRIDWNIVEREYGLSKWEVEHVISIIRRW